MIWRQCSVARTPQSAPVSHDAEGPGFHSRAARQRHSFKGGGHAVVVLGDTQMKPSKGRPPAQARVSARSYRRLAAPETAPRRAERSPEGLEVEKFEVGIRALGGVLVHPFGDGQADRPGACRRRRRRSSYGSFGMGGQGAGDGVRRRDRPAQERRSTGSVQRPCIGERGGVVDHLVAHPGSLEITTDLAWAARTSATPRRQRPAGRHRSHGRRELQNLAHEDLRHRGPRRHTNGAHAIEPTLVDLGGIVDRARPATRARGRPRPDARNWRSCASRRRSSGRTPGHLLDGQLTVLGGVADVVGRRILERGELLPKQPHGLHRLVDRQGGLTARRPSPGRGPRHWRHRPVRRRS